MASSNLSGSGVLSPESFSLVHSREVSDSSESYASLDVSEDPSSDDEIVWSLSDNESVESPSPVLLRSQGAFSPATFSDEDVVVLGDSQSVTEQYQSLAVPGSVEALANTLSNLQVGPRRTRTKKAKKPTSVATEAEQSTASTAKLRRKKRRASAASAASATSAATPTPQQTTGTKRKARKAKVALAKPASVAAPQSQSEDDHALSIVDDVSEAELPSAYQEAVQYVSDFLADPAATANSNLKLLHALIIELGLAPQAASQVSSLGMAAEALPRSLRAAKALLKSHVYLNIRDYLANRHLGADALRGAMHPSRRALAKTIRGGNRVPAKQVKKSGLGVLLITCYRCAAREQWA